MASCERKASGVFAIEVGRGDSGSERHREPVVVWTEDEETAKRIYRGIVEIGARLYPSMRVRLVRVPDGHALLKLKLPVPR